MRRAARWLGLGVLLGGAVACNELGPSFRRVDVRVVPDAVTLDAVGATTTLVAEVTESDGDPVVGAQVSWRSSDATVADVDDEGVVVARGRGSATVTATATALGVFGVQATARVDVVPRVTSLAIVSGDGQTGPAGATLADPIVVRAVDRLGAPVVGVELAFTVLEGGGTVSAPAAPTDADGRVRLDWTLGSTAGAPQRLGLRAPSGVEVEAIATAVAGTPALVESVTNLPAYAVEGASLLVEIRVVDGLGNAVPGVSVAFDPGPGSGTADPSATLTDGSGSAAATWRLGADAGPQTLDVSAGGAAARLAVTATEPPAAVRVVAGDGQTAEVATTVSVPPTVRVDDGAGSPVPGVPVTFTVTAGGGLLGPGDGAAAVVALTGVDGTATPGAWTVGTVAGVANQSVRAEVEGLVPRVFTASAAAGAPASMVIVAGDGQTGPVTAPLPSAPSVRLGDAFDNPVPGVAVRFTADGGYADPAEALTDAAGVASTVWTLGPVAGARTLTARVDDGVPAVTFTATATGSVSTCDLAAPSPGFDIQICPVGMIDGTATAAVSAAVARWEALVTGDVPDVAPNVEHATCAPDAPWVTGPQVDDLVIYVVAESVDGPGGALAGAAPCFVRDDGGLPLFARLRLDADDVADLDAQGLLVDVVVHELAHALGFGTLWPAAGLLRDPSVGATGSVDTWFAGAQAIAAFDAAGGGVRTIGPTVPVQRTGGGGVADVHWRESVMDSELLTAFLDVGVPNPLSAVTVASLADLGYEVDVNLADPYVVPFPNLPVVMPNAPRQDGTRIRLLDDLWWGPFGVVDADGRLVRRPHTDRRSPP